MMILKQFYFVDVLLLFAIMTGKDVARYVEIS
jgi:hypothetical protein